MHIKQISIFPDRFPATGVYPFNCPVFKNQKNLQINKNVVFFVGENGTGKSTLLKAVSNKCGIYIWRDDSYRRFDINRYEEDLYKYIEVEWSNGTVPGAFFASEIFRHFAQLVDEWASCDPGLLRYYGDKSLMSQSHGQCHLAFYKSRFVLKGLYLLDEPENALSPSKQIEFLSLLERTTKSCEAQFIIATHSPIILSYPDAQIFSFDHPVIEEIDYKETSHYIVYNDFFNGNI